MYINSFFKSLCLLKEDKLPSLDILPKRNVFYYGYQKKNDYTDVSEVPKEHDYLVYAELNEVLELKYVEIDNIIEYIEKLNAIEYYKFNGDYIALYEALWLFDEINTLTNNPFYEVSASAPMPTALLYLSKDSAEEENILGYFNGNLVLRDLFIAQFKYFIKIYVKTKVEYTQASNTIVSNEIFTYELYTVLVDYLKKTPTIFNTQLYTKDKNEELEEFLQQLDYHKGDFV